MGRDGDSSSLPSKKQAAGAGTTNAGTQSGSEELGAQPVRESAVSTPHTASEQFTHMSPTWPVFHPLPKKRHGELVWSVTARGTVSTSGRVL